MPARTATHTNVASSATVVDLCAANQGRNGFSVFNDSSQALYVKLGSAASSTSFNVKIAAGGYWEMPDGWGYKGLITGVWASANGYGRVCEIA